MNSRTLLVAPLSRTPLTRWSSQRSRRVLRAVVPAGNRCELVSTKTTPIRHIPETGVARGFYGTPAPPPHAAPPWGWLMSCWPENQNPGPRLRLRDHLSVVLTLASPTSVPFALSVTTTRTEPSRCPASDAT